MYWREALCVCGPPVVHGLPRTDFVLSSFSPLTKRTAATVRSYVREKSARASDRVFLLESSKVIQELLLASPPQIQLLIATSDWLSQHFSPPGHTDPKLNVATCSHSVLQQLTGTSTAQEAIAIVRQPQWDESSFLQKPRFFGVYAESLQDPANVGTLIRTAAAFGIDALWLGPGSADAYNPKVVRGTVGTLLRLPVFQGKELSEILAGRCTVYSADSNSEHALTLTQLTSRPKRLIVAFGNESRGLSSDLRRRSSYLFHIPLQSHVESLNVGVAAGIALHYVSRLPVSPA